jgi:hypothetical protein
MLRANGSSVFDVQYVDISVVDITAPSFQSHVLAGEYQNLDVAVVAAKMRKTTRKEDTRMRSGQLSRDCFL